MPHIPLTYRNELANLREANVALNRARRTIIDLAPQPYRSALQAYHQSPSAYLAAIEQAVMESKFVSADARSWRARDTFSCPLCGEGFTVPTGMLRHIGVDPKGQQKFCRVVEAGWALSVQAADLRERKEA